MNITENQDVRYVDSDDDLDAIDIARVRDEFEIEMTRAALPSGSRILEIGYGHGHFMQWARERGHTVVGTEISPGLHEAVKRAGYDVYLGRLEQLDFSGEEKFDAVVAFDVFEHLTIPELRSMLECLHGLLTENGFVFARFPNGSSPFGLAFQNGDITHRTALNAFSIKQLSDLTGFTVGFCRNAARPLTGRKARVLKRLAYVACDIIETVVAVLYFRGRRIPLDNNLVCVLRRRKDA